MALTDKSAGILLSMFQDIYRQEIGAEEDIHRTLPFFATALGLIITALAFASGHLPSWAKSTQACPDSTAIVDWFTCRWPILIFDALLGAAICASFGVLRYLSKATKRRNYMRVGPEPAVVDRAQQLEAYYSGLSLTGSNLDDAVAADLREQLIKDYAQVISLNRNITSRRYQFRSLAVTFLLASLFAAVAATTFLIVTTEFGFMQGVPS